MQRHKAWQIRSYPFIGLWFFVKCSIKWAELDNEYALILHRVKQGATLLDVGCGLAQDFRWLAADNAPTENLYAAGMRTSFRQNPRNMCSYFTVDIIPDFWNLSLDMFRDRSKMHAKFIQSDILDPNSQLLFKLSGKADIIVATDFLHLFAWKDYIEATCRLVQLGRSEPGTTIIGKMCGMKRGQTIPTDYGKDGISYMHSEETFRQSWREVGRLTGSYWTVQVEKANLREDPVDQWWAPKEDWAFLGDEIIGLRFVCVREELTQ